MKQQVEDVEQLKKWFEHYVSQYKTASSTKKRLEELIQRKSSSKWSVEKKDKVLKRHEEATKSQVEAEDILDRLEYRLSQNGIEVDVVRRSSVKR